MPEVTSHEFPGAAPLPGPQADPAVRCEWKDEDEVTETHGPAHSSLPPWGPGQTSYAF